MAREGCNLDKDEAEILKPSASSSSSSTAPPPPQSSQPSSLFLKPPPEVQRKPEAEARLPSPRGSVGCKRKKEEQEEEEEKEEEKCLLPHAPPPATVTVVRQVNRCRSCLRKVGLTGFRCRCGDLFCARHRYSDAHGCPYDYKTAGREEISRNNPVVRAPKIIKI